MKQPHTSIHLNFTFQSTIQFHLCCGKAQIHQTLGIVREAYAPCAGVFAV